MSLLDYKDRIYNGEKFNQRIGGMNISIAQCGSDGMYMWLREIPVNMAFEVVYFDIPTRTFTRLFAAQRDDVCQGTLHVEKIVRANEFDTSDFYIIATPAWWNGPDEGRVYRVTNQRMKRIFSSRGVVDAIRVGTTLAVLILDQRIVYIRDGEVVSRTEGMYDRIHAITETQFIANGGGTIDFDIIDVFTGTVGGSVRFTENFPINNIVDSFGGTFLVGGTGGMILQAWITEDGKVAVQPFYQRRSGVPDIVLAASEQHIVLREEGIVHLDSGADTKPPRR